MVSPHLLCPDFLTTFQVRCGTSSTTRHKEVLVAAVVKSALCCDSNTHRSAERHRSTQMTTTNLCYMISVYLKYSICKCLFPLKTKTTFTASSLHSKQKGRGHPSVSSTPSPPKNIYVVCLKALVWVWDSNRFENLLRIRARMAELRGTIWEVDNVGGT